MLALHNYIETQSVLPICVINPSAAAAITGQTIALYHTAHVLLLPFMDQANIYKKVAF